MTGSPSSRTPPARQPGTPARPIALPRTGLGQLLRRMRQDAGLTLDQVGALTHISRKGVCNRELHGSALPATALVEHARALGYDLALIPRKAA